MIPFITLASIGIAIPIVASFIICFPKWWEEVVAPHILESLISISIPAPNIFAWYMVPARIILLVLYSPFFTFVVVLIKYWHSVASLIERKCPYTPSWVADSLDSRQKNAERFKGKFPGCHNVSPLALSIQ